MRLPFQNKPSVRLSPPQDEATERRVVEQILRDSALAGVPWLTLTYEFTWTGPSNSGSQQGAWTGAAAPDGSETGGAWFTTNAHAYWTLRRLRQTRGDTTSATFRVEAKRSGPDAPIDVTASWLAPA